MVSMYWWAVAVAGVVAAAVLILAASADNRSRRRRQGVLSGPPDRTIPGLPADAGTPTYICPDTDPIPVETDSDSDSDLTARIERATALEGGWARDRFITDPDSRWAVLRAPVVLITPLVHAFRELWPAVSAARDRHTGLVVAATAFDTATLDTLVMNATHGSLACVAVRCPSENALGVVAAATGGSVIDPISLRSGHIPATSLGTCATWVSADVSSWALTAADD
jgi:hypothetical protein